MAIAALMFVCGLATVTTSCDDKDDNETNSEWKLRNSINGVGWCAKAVMVNGTWINDSDPEFYEKGICFNIKFSASNRNFKCWKYYWTPREGVEGEYVAIESTREEYGYSDGTAYTIKGKVVEGTVNGNPFFKMEVLEKPTSDLHCKVTFYKENKTLELSMARALL